MAKKTLTTFVPVEERDPATVRAVILARKSSTGVESDVQSQVEACQQFIERKGWTLIADPYKYTEIGKSGRYNVERKVLESVVLLAERREVDVIVAREPERLSRKSEQRTFYMEYCKRYSVEWRFANLPPDGKLPDSLEGRIVGSVLEYFGEIEAERIAERMTPGRERRYAAGLPAGGRTGAPYGFKWRPKEPDDKTYSAFIEDPDQAPIVREIYSRLATDEHASARGLARELTERGVPSATGSHWNGTAIIEMVRNPVYCGRGRRKRWQTAREEKVNEATGRMHNYAVVRDRMLGSDYEQETYPLAEGSVPILVEPNVWEAAQRAIERNRVFGGKTERKNSPYPKDATLLHGGFVFCARCHGMMTRHWRSTSPIPKPLYTCTSQVSNPSHHCARHGINAEKVDHIVLLTLAKALTDTEQLLDLADQADQQAIQAAADADRASTELDVYRALAADREKKRAGYMSAIASLSAIPGDDNRDTITDLRAKLAQLDREQVAAEEQRKSLIPQLERARRRTQILERLTWVKDKYHRIIPQEGEARPNVLSHVSSRPELTVYGEPKRVVRPFVSLEDAALILGVSEQDFTNETGIPILWSWDGYAADDPEGKVDSDVATEHVIYYWLVNSPRDYVRQLLRDLNVRVLIKPPRTKDERAVNGLTPHKERVIVRFLVDPNEEAQLRPSDKKAHDFRSRSRW